MPAIFSSMYALKPCSTESTIMNAATPMIIPSSVKKDLSLCAQIAAKASRKVSERFILCLDGKMDADQDQEPTHVSQRAGLFIA